MSGTDWIIFLDGQEWSRGPREEQEHAFINLVSARMARPGGHTLDLVQPNDTIAKSVKISGACKLITAKMTDDREQADAERWAEHVEPIKAAIATRPGLLDGFAARLRERAEFIRTGAGPSSIASVLDEVANAATGEK